MTILKLSLRWSETTEAISLQATLVFFGLLRYARNDKSQDGHEAKASRHDNLYYVRDDIPKLAASFLPAVFASGLSLANRVREKQSTCIFQKIF